MYKEHPDFEPPKNINSRIWRYMDLPRFLSLIESSSLYFTRADKFADPYEGAIPKLHKESMESYFSEFDNAEEMKQELLDLFEINRKMTLINCWYQSEYESDAMWQLYSNNGIAIQSTFDRFTKAISVAKESIYIGQVKYIDYEKEGLYFLNALTPFLFKRQSFEHEKEIRAVIWHTENDKISTELDKVPIEILEHGKLVEINIEELIELIYVSPTAPSWFHKLIITMLKRYGIKKDVIHSNLYSIDDLSKSITKDSKNEINISKEVLEHFYKKDSYRINIETLKTEREKFREYENFVSEIKALETEINKITFSLKIKYTGKEALMQFSSIQYSKNELEKLFNKTQFKTLYFTTGKVDTLMSDIKESNLSSKEKEILFRKIIYFYSENIFHAAINIASQIDKHNVTVEIYQNFKKFTMYMHKLIVEK